MTVNIYVGNLSYDMTDNALKDAFSRYGEVALAKVVFDRDTGRSRGFGFVEMPDGEEARKAIDALNGAELMGRNMRVNEARPPKERR